ncbi:hypothetical protein [Streptomyces sp. NBC_00564]|uniref:hypothetical protein n=1 Tax=Streptomyces sp. NBC_00564 TaxID=2903663 RepID=UPI00352D0805|nr:hypothetical protein OG256_21835 [Streptomyces sp. NBC_00564]
MKLGYFVAAAVLLTPIPFAGMAQPAAALEETHVVVLKGNLRVISCCGFLGMGNGDETFPFWKQVGLTRSNQRAYLEITGCAGGEARGILEFRLRLNDSDKLFVRPTLLLYEGASCNSDDKDAEVYPYPTEVAANSGATVWEIGVFNNEFRSLDEVWANFTATHSLWP